MSDRRSKFAVTDETPDWFLWDIACQILGLILDTVNGIYKDLEKKFPAKKPDEIYEFIVRQINNSGIEPGVIFFVTSSSESEFHLHQKLIAFIHVLAFRYSCSLTEIRTPNPNICISGQTLRTFRIRLTTKEIE